MKLTLRDYQDSAVAAVRSAYASGLRAPLLTLPTGGGKTVVFSYIAEQAGAKGNRVLILVHRRELLRQTSRTLDDFGVCHGMISAGMTTFIGHPVQVASVQTLVRRMDRLRWDPDLIIVDEAHHATGKTTWGKVLAHYTGAKILGVTATPQRLDGQGLGISAGGMFDRLITGPTVAQLTAAGHLSPAVVFAPRQRVDLSGVHTRMGDFAQGELADAMDKPTITGDAVAHYRAHCPGEPAIAFCASVAHAEHVAETFQAAGYRAASIDGGMDSATRAQHIEDLGSGRLQVLTSCEIVSEGTDIPVVAAAILLRPTQSLGLYLQQVGRVLRPAPGKTHCIAEGQLVLTDTGLVPIEDVTTSMRVWDGVEFVTHCGAIFHGERDVIEYAGVVVTQDHRLWTAQGWKEAGECSIKQIPVAQTGNGRTAIRESEGRFVGGLAQRKGRQAGFTVRMRRLWGAACSLVWKPYQGHGWMPRVRQKIYGTHLVGSQVQWCQAKMRERLLHGMAKLWWAWNQVSVWISFGDGALCDTASWARQVEANRQNQQRRTLRAWEYSPGDRKSEHGKHQKYEMDADASRFQGTSPGYSLRGLYDQAVADERTDRRGDRKQVESPKLQTKRRVWDLLNAGPRHRFTVQGVLVSNCVILDHVGNCFRHGLPDDDREWSLEGRDKATRAKTDDAAPVRQCEQCYTVHRPAPRCPACGFLYPSQAREIEEVAGTLEQVDPMEIRRIAKAAQAKAKSLDDLIALGRARGYKNPYGWASFVWKARQGKAA